MPRGAIPEYPPILRGTVEEQMIQLREYIIRNIEAMQRDLTASGGSIYVDNGVAYVNINGSTMTLQEFIQNYVNSDGNTINITVNANIENNPDLQDKTITITANGTQTVTPDEGKDGLSSVEITVNVPQGITPSGTINITNNGTHDVTNYASANVQVPSAAPNLQSKNATPSGSAQTIVPDSGYDGLSSVIIAAAPLDNPRTIMPSASDQRILPSSGNIGFSELTVAGDADLIAGNIKKDIVIFGVTGTYDGGGSVNGSLIEITCSSNIDAVTATVNGNTYNAYMYNHVAYVVIPYTETMQSASTYSCSLKGFNNGSQVTSTSVTMNKGVGHYTADLSTSEYIFNYGQYYGVADTGWTLKGDGQAQGSAVNGTNSIQFTCRSGDYRHVFELNSTIDTRGYQNFEITYVITEGAITGGGDDRARGNSFVGIGSNYPFINFPSSNGAVSITTRTSVNGAAALSDAKLTFAFTCPLYIYNVGSGVPLVIDIYSIKLV